jgi:hypothetical protein
MPLCSCEYCIARAQDILRSGRIECPVYLSVADGTAEGPVLLVTDWERTSSVWASDGSRHATLLQACRALRVPLDRLVVRDCQLGNVPVAALVGVTWQDAQHDAKWMRPSVHCANTQNTPCVCGAACTPAVCRNPSPLTTCGLLCEMAPGVRVRAWTPPPQVDRLAVTITRRRKTVPEWCDPTPDEWVQSGAGGTTCSLTAETTPVALWSPSDVAAYLGRSMHTHRGCSWVPGADLHLLRVLAVRTRGETGVLLRDDVLCEFQAAPGESTRLWVQRSALAMHVAHWDAVQQFERQEGSRFEELSAAKPRPRAPNRPGATTCTKRKRASSRLALGFKGLGVDTWGSP